MRRLAAQPRRMARRIPPSIRPSIRRMAPAPPPPPPQTRFDFARRMSAQPRRRMGRGRYWVVIQGFTGPDDTIVLKSGSLAAARARAQTELSNPQWNAVAIVDCPTATCPHDDEHLPVCISLRDSPAAQWLPSSEGGGQFPSCAPTMIAAAQALRPRRRMRGFGQEGPGAKADSWWADQSTAAKVAIGAVAGVLACVILR